MLVGISNITFASDFPESIDSYTAKGFSGELVGLHDPGYITIKMENGQTIDTTYSGIDFDTLYDWVNTSDNTKKRSVTIKYSTQDGVTVKDEISEQSFILDGDLYNHPIDMGLSACRTQYYSTPGIKACQELALQAWDRELNRVYKALGGSENQELKQVHRTWIQFRDSFIKYLQTEYGSYQGSVWGISYMEQVISITRQQTINLQSISEDKRSANL